MWQLSKVRIFQPREGAAFIFSKVSVKLVQRKYKNLKYIITQNTCYVSITIYQSDFIIPMCVGFKGITHTAAVLYRQALYM